MGITRYVAALALFFLSSTAASAYEDDTHYLMTYVICRTVGFTHDEALYVAAADVAMDDRDNTVAAGSFDTPGSSSFYPHVDAQWMWHAIDPRGWGWNPPDTLRQKNLLFQLALDKWLDPSLLNPNPDPKEISAQVKERLLWLGVFFHYQQDTWAHRRPNEWDTRTKFQAYQTPFGHVGAVYWGPFPLAIVSPAAAIVLAAATASERDERYTIHNQDLPPWHPLAALRNLEDGIIYAGFFLKAVLNRPPNRFFVNFEIGQGKDRNDLTWPKRSAQFNQLSSVAKTDAGKYLEALIRAQIDTYGKNTDGTAQENNSLEEVRKAFAKVWQEYAGKGKLDLGEDYLSSVPLNKDPDPKDKDKKDRGSVLGEYRPYNTDFGPKQLVAKMGGWQDVLGFPTTAKLYSDLEPSSRGANLDLLTLTGAWKSVPSVGGPSSFSDLMPWQNTFLAVAEGALWYKDKQEKWQPVQNSRPNDPGKLVAAKLHRDGVVLEVLASGKLASNTLRNTPDGSPRFDAMWETTATPPGEIESLTVMRDDGTKIFGVVGGKLQTTRLLKDPKYRLESWQDVLPTEKIPVLAVTLTLNQRSFLGVSRNGVLLYKSDLTIPWKQAPNANALTSGDAVGGTVALRSVTMLPNGDLLGIRKDTGELLVKRSCVSDPQPTAEQLWNVSTQCSSWPSFLNPDRLPD
jgi:hypothetical protein